MSANKQNFIKVIVGILSAFLFMSFETSSFISRTNEGKQLVLRISPGPDNPRNSEGSFITLKDGRILFIYSRFTGNSSGDGGQAYLAGIYSGDGGKTWDKESKVIIKQEGLQNVMSVSLLRLQNGNIALFYVRKNSDSDCIPMMRISKDETQTWSEPVACIPDRKGYFVLNNDRVIQTKNGRLVMPVSLHKTPEDPKFSNVGKISSYYSDDNGQTWTAGKEVPNPDDIVLQEPGIVELKCGDLLMLIRTDRGVQYFSRSGDEGKTWSSAEPGNIDSPCSPASIKRIPLTGDLLMVWNNNGKNQKRTPLNIAISKNEGKSWKKIQTIEDDPDGWYCYTAIHFTGKNVLLAYCAGSQSKKTHLSIINITELSLDWIYK